MGHAVVEKDQLLPAQTRIEIGGCDQGIAVTGVEGLGHSGRAKSGEEEQASHDEAR
jgi:hypothetical protein